MRKWDRVKSSHDPAREAGMRRIIITAITLIWLGGCGDDTPATAKTGSTNDACYMAQKFVSGRLKAPATADFQPCREASMSPQSDGLAGARYSVFSYVDSQNGFGAKIRNNYLAVLQYEGYDQSKRQYDWSLVSLAMEGQTWTNPNFAAQPPPAPIPPATERRAKKQ
jgi:hypothetical protein